jgi:hypothetical protein
LAHAPKAPAECPNIGHRLPTTRNAVIWPPLSAFSLAISACQLFSVSAFALVGSVASSGLTGDQGKARFIDWWPLAISAFQHFSISAFVLLFRFTIIWESMIVIIREKRAEVIEIIWERVEPRAA